MDYWRVPKVDTRVRFVCWHPQRMWPWWTLNLSCYSYVTHSDKRVTKSLRRSRDNLGQLHLGVNLIIFLVFDFSHCRARVCSILFLLLTAHFDLYMTLKHIANCKSLLWLKQCQSFQLHFLEKATPLPPYFKRASLRFGLRHSLGT